MPSNGSRAGICSLYPRSSRLRLGALRLAALPQAEAAEIEVLMTVKDPKPGLVISDSHFDEQFPLAPIDDYMIHQTPDPIRVVWSTDPRIYERFWVICHDNKGELLLVTGAELLSESRYRRSLRDRQFQGPAYFRARVSASRRGPDEHGHRSDQTHDHPGDARVALRAGRKRMGYQLRPALARYQAAGLQRLIRLGGRRLSARQTRRRHRGLRGLRRR